MDQMLPSRLAFLIFYHRLYVLSNQGQVLWMPKICSISSIIANVLVDLADMSITDVTFSKHGAYP